MRCIQNLKLVLTVALACFLFTNFARATESDSTPNTTTVQTTNDKEKSPPPMLFTARFTAEDLIPLLNKHTDMLPFPLQAQEKRDAAIAALKRVNMGVLIEELTPFLSADLPGKFNPQHDRLWVPVPAEKQVTIEGSSGNFAGPSREVVGFLLHDIDERTYINVAIRVLQRARQLIDSGDPVVDRSSDSYYRLIATQQFEEIKAQQRRRDNESATRETARRILGQKLEIFDKDGNPTDKRAKWVKESRRFSYVVKEGRFIDKLAPLVEQINAEIALADIAPPSLIDKPGIHFDDDLKDVEILLPRQDLERFLEEADAIERRMAEDAMITIEVVRLTDRDIVNGAVASQLDVSSTAVHDIERFDQKSVLKQATINTMMAIANRQLQIVNLEEIAAGNLPEGTSPLTLPAIEMPPVLTERRATTVGGEFSIGADDVFFDGREQSYGFSYIGPDGLSHTLSMRVVDNLRKLWDRIERNLIVHKIKKTPNKESFSVPVGPKTKTFEGIAALISQENQQLVVATGTGAISELSATAGTWLVIKDFEITPIPGSSTALTEHEIAEINGRTLLTMLLRDPLIELNIKTQLVETEDRKTLSNLLNDLEEKYIKRQLHVGLDKTTFGEALERRRRETINAAAIEKKERNSKISLTFYSSQGNIIKQTGVTALGDSNDLTSFTTELTPNVATPISSFFTKLASGTEDSSALTGAPKGEQEIREKTMAHLVVRACFPTTEREKKDQDEGRHLGYFNLPQDKTPISTINLPLLSSSEHPLKRLSQLRVGVLFPSLDETRIRKTKSIFNPQRIVGDLPKNVWETCMTRMLMNQRIATNSPTANQAIASVYRQRFITEVRSLLEYDEDLYEAPNIALRNMASWNDAHRIVLALRNSAEQFALQRLVKMIDELGEILVPQIFIDTYLATAPPASWGRHHLYPLTKNEIKTLRRDVASHFMRTEEVFGDAFLEAIAMILDLPTYQSFSYSDVTSKAFRGYRDLVIFDNSTAAFSLNGDAKEAHDHFILLRNGGYKGKLFEPSLEYLEDLDNADKTYIIRGTNILDHPEFSTSKK